MGVAEGRLVGWLSDVVTCSRARSAGRAGSEGFTCCLARLVGVGVTVCACVVCVYLSVGSPRFILFVSV